MFSSIKLPDLGEYIGTISKNQPYREPDTTETQQFLADFDKLLAGNVYGVGHLPDLGYQVVTGVDEQSGKSYILAKNKPGSDRAWGAFLFEKNVSPRIVVTAPHPKADSDTETIALELWRKIPNSLLMIAGAHRHASNDGADVAHERDSLFHQVSADLFRRQFAHVQIHGFADDTVPDKDIILSTGQASVTPHSTRIAANLQQAGLSVGTNWDGKTSKLLAETNVQGHAARQHDAVFLHVELNNSIRSSDRLNEVLDIIAKEWQ